MGRKARKVNNLIPWNVSIQLISPASGERYKDWERGGLCMTVSIQLISPASGELRMDTITSTGQISECFHSINFPSEWGATTPGDIGWLNVGSFPFN